MNPPISTLSAVSPRSRVEIFKSCVAGGATGVAVGDGDGVGVCGGGVGVGECGVGVGVCGVGVGLGVCTGVGLGVPIGVGVGTSALASKNPISIRPLTLR